MPGTPRLLRSSLGSPSLEIKSAPRSPAPSAPSHSRTGPRQPCPAASRHARRGGFGLRAQTLESDKPGPTLTLPLSAFWPGAVQGSALRPISHLLKSIPVPLLCCKCLARWPTTGTRYRLPSSHHSIPIPDLGPLGLLLRAGCSGREEGRSAGRAKEGERLLSQGSPPPASRLLMLLSFSKEALERPGGGRFQGTEDRRGPEPSETGPILPPPEGCWARASHRNISSASSNSHSPLGGSCCWPHFTDDDTEALRSDLPSATWRTQGRDRIQNQGL